MGFLDSLIGNSKTPRHLLITDVTRMEGDKVCIAALDGDKAVRLHTPQPRESWVDSMKGLAPGDKISSVWRPAKRYTPPHTEDGGWVPGSVEKTGRLVEAELIQHLVTTAYSSVVAAFGEAKFISQRGNPAFQPNRGPRSLASLRVKRVHLRPIGEGIRADFVDMAGDVWKMVPVEDLALRRHQTSCAECADDGLEERLTAEFAGGDAVLRIGLGRAYRPDDQHHGCYLQVNHVFLIPSRREHFVLS